MFPNRPAMKKEISPQAQIKQPKSSELKDEFLLIRDAVQKILLTNSNIDTSMDTDLVRKMIEDCFNQVLEEENILYNHFTRNEMLEWVIADIIGYGPIEPLLRDSDITEIMVNGYDKIFVERFGLIEPTSVKFEDDAHLLRIIDRIVSPIGRRVDETSPMVDARLPNGYRVNATIAPLSLDGPILTIRKFATHPFTMQDLVMNGTLTIALANFLKGCVEARVNVAVSGGTGTGKTTFLNVLSSFIPEGERVITIEGTAELQLHQKHVVRLEKRPPNVEGKGEITIRQLVINALRMRPDRIVVGECRAGEALDMLQAETMVMMAGMELPLKAIREQVASSIELIVHLARMKDGTRKIVQVSEVQGMESDTIVMQDLFVFNQTGIQNGVVQGSLEPTGLRPRFMHKLVANNIEMPEGVFEK